MQKLLTFPLTAVATPHCVLCKSTETQFVSFLYTDLLVARWKEWMHIDIQEEIKEVKRIEFHRCKECHLGFFEPHPLVGSATMYAELGKLGGTEYYPEEKWEFLEGVKDLKSSSQALEIGSGSGEFLKLALKSGVCIEGIELNPTAVANGQQEGLPVQAMDLKELAKSGRRFDAICSFQVLEHVEDPLSFVKACATLLNPGGKLVLAVPNADSFLKYQYNLMDLPPHHLTRWRSNTFAYLTKKLPLKMVKIAEEPLATLHAASYVEGVAGKLGKFQRLFRPFLRRFLIYVIKTTSIRKYLRGQTLYAVFERV